MSFRRKTYDGVSFGGSHSATERRDTFDSESKAGKYASPKTTSRNLYYLRGGQETPEDNSDKDRYLITYADLITLLLGLFIILYAISNIDLQKYDKMEEAMGYFFGNEAGITALQNTQSNPIPTEIDNLRNNLTQLLKNSQISKSVTLEENERGFTIHILENILFTSGKAELNSTSRLVLSELAAIMKNIPNDIRVEGHTDNLPINSSIYPSNWHLSVARALNTAYYLINVENLGPTRVSIVGYSEYQPLADNSTFEGRAKNRRVDIVIIKK